jgi:uncharacterized BrkB/YihY/UPF0761 family membrane protein
VAVLITSYGASIYFGVAGQTAAGLAGALFVILLLANIFSSVFLFGAELTKAYELYLNTGTPPDANFDSPGHQEAQPITSRDDGN